MRQVLLTGATGCLGSYLLAALLAKSDCHVTAWVRQPHKIWAPWRRHPRLTLLVGDLRQLPAELEIFKRFDALIHPAVVWGGPDTFAVNFRATRRLFQALDPVRCRQIHYFSTASLLDAHHRLWPQAHTLGTDYIRSKAALAAVLAEQSLPVHIYYPPLILGGDGQAHPLTPVTAALPQLRAYLPFLRYLSVDGGLHFIHAADLAALVVQRLYCEAPPAALVPGQPWCSVRHLIEAFAAQAGLAPAGLQLPLQALLPGLCYVLQAQMSAWDRFSLHIRTTRYRVLRPEDQGLISRYPRWEDILRTYL